MSSREVLPQRRMFWMRNATSVRVSPLMLESESMRVLEFASGIGCVSRHPKAPEPKYSFVCCDIHRAAIGYISMSFGMQTTMVPGNLSV
jgi:hypothetical protein